MYLIESDLEKREYLGELKRSFKNPFFIFDERVCGIVMGPFFSVAYHSPYEWNRRITSECNRAWGYVKERNGKSEVRCVFGKGMLSPFWLVFYMLLCFVMFVLIFAYHDAVRDVVSEFRAFFWCSVVVSLIVCVVSAVHSCLTDQGLLGQAELIRLLEKPEEYYG